MSVHHPEGGHAGDGEHPFLLSGNKWGDSGLAGTPGGVVNVSFDADAGGRRFFPLSDSLGPAFRQDAIEGFRLWSEVADIQFNFLPDGADPELIDILVGWNSFDGPGNRLGETSNSPGPRLPGPDAPFGSLVRSTITMDIDEPWNVGDDDPSFDERDFSAVLAHEAGHAIGLAHPGGGEPALMQALYRDDVLTLRPGDIIGAQSIYGPASPSGDDVAPDGPATPGTIVFDGFEHGVIEAAGDEDWYALPVFSGRSYQIDLEALALPRFADPMLRLHDASGAEIARNDDRATGTRDSRLQYTAQADGQVFVVADARGDGTGSYGLTVGEVDDVRPDGVGTDGRIAVGGDVTGLLESVNDEDWYAVRLRAGVEYLIELTAQGDDPLGDPLLRLADASGLEVARDDDGGAGTDSALSYTPSETGRHFVIADMPFGLDTGGYLVSLRQSPDAGTPGADVLIGGSASDRLEGLDGDDVLRGEAGDDTLLGGDGSDTLDGGDGNDTIRGGATGADRRDVIFAGAGDDDVDGGHGNDQLNGGSGNDRLAGGFGVDEVRGNAGDDVMTGSAFSDLIFGGPGFDFVNGGFGFDRVNGGDDADRFFHTGDAGHGSDWIQDYDAAEGDVLLYGGQAQPDQFRVITTETRNAGQAGVEEAFVVHTQTGQILWALVDGGGQDAINLSLGGQLVDLFG